MMMRGIFRPEMIEAARLEDWRSDIRKDLIEKTYRPALTGPVTPSGIGLRRSAIEAQRKT
jgi:hypothetical protein